MEKFEAAASPEQPVLPSISTVSAWVEIAGLLNCDLTPDAIAAIVGLIQAGVHPQALSAAILELLAESKRVGIR